MTHDVGFYAAKFSLIALYYNLISAAFFRLRIALHVVTFYVVASCLVTFLCDVVWCMPVSDNW